MYPSGLHDGQISVNEEKTQIVLTGLNLVSALVLEALQHPNCLPTSMTIKMIRKVYLGIISLLGRYSYTKPLDQ